MSKGHQNLQDVLKHLREAKDKLFEDSLPDKAAKLMDQMAVDPSAFLKQVSITSDGDNTFCSIPVLATIEPVEFVDKLLALLRERQHTVFLALHNRYDAPLVELQPERVWLTRVTEMLKDRANSMSPIAAAVLRRHIDNDLAPFIQRDKSESSEARPAS